jgi:hypothetical protein
VNKKHDAVTLHSKNWLFTKITVLWNLKPCSWKVGANLWEEPAASLSTMKMEIADSYEALVPVPGTNNDF